MTYKVIPLHPTLLAGSDGHIYRQSDKTILKEYPGNGEGKYLSVTVSGKRLVHILVCAAYHGPKPAKHEVSHEDGDWRNNKPDNLKWRTRSSNHKLKLLHGTHDRGSNNSRAVLKENQVTWVRQQLELGRTHISIAQALGVGRTTITRISTGDRYKIVTQGDMQLAA